MDCVQQELFVKSSYSILILRGGFDSLPFNRDSRAFLRSQTGIPVASLLQSILKLDHIPYKRYRRGVVLCFCLYLVFVFVDRDMPKSFPGCWYTVVGIAQRHSKCFPYCRHHADKDFQSFWLPLSSISPFRTSLRKFFLLECYESLHESPISCSLGMYSVVGDIVQRRPHVSAKAKRKGRCACQAQPCSLSDSIPSHHSDNPIRVTLGPRSSQMGKRGGNRPNLETTRASC